jgi:PPOX class probable FMN-dependent enzyme
VECRPACKISDNIDDGDRTMTQISGSESLHTHYAEPHPRAVCKEIAALEQHSSKFIGLSPFCVLATVGSDGKPDLSPRGGAPGFVRVQGQTLLLPDSTGNNRLDTLGKLADNPTVAILFLVPGFQETLRVYGTTELLAEGEFEGVSSGDSKPAKTALRVHVNKVYFQCGKAVMRADLWNPEANADRSAMPSLGKILNDQIGDPAPGETQEEIEQIYRETL